MFLDVEKMELLEEFKKEYHAGCNYRVVESYLDGNELKVWIGLNGVKQFYLTVKRDEKGSIIWF